MSEPDRDLERLARLIESGDANDVGEIARLLSMGDDQCDLPKTLTPDQQSTPSKGFMRSLVDRYWPISRKPNG